MIKSTRICLRAGWRQNIAFPFYIGGVGFCDTRVRVRVHTELGILVVGYIMTLNKKIWNTKHVIVKIWICIDSLWPRMSWWFFIILGDWSFLVILGNFHKISAKIQIELSQWQCESSQQDFKFSFLKCSSCQSFPSKVE